MSFGEDDPRRKYKLIHFRRTMEELGTMTENNGLGEPLVDMNQVADFLGCSTRKIYRLVDSGRMPRPIKVGRNNRWNHEEIVAWTNDGCPSCRTINMRGRRR